jgi:hypothetical protein
MSSENENASSRRVMNDGLNVELAVSPETVNKKKDCLACRLTSSAGLFIMATYVFSNVRKQTSRTKSAFINLLGSGILDLV